MTAMWGAAAAGQRDLAVSPRSSAADQKIKTKVGTSLEQSFDAGLPNNCSCPEQPFADFSTTDRSTWELDAPGWRWIECPLLTAPNRRYGGARLPLPAVSGEGVGLRWTVKLP